MPTLIHYASLQRDRIDPEEIRRLTAKARESGLIRDQATLSKIVKNGTPVAAAGELRSQWMDITPEIAQNWIKNNVRNRTVSDDTVTAYARDMAAGSWVSTHQGLAFNDRDELIDGQHRLLAIIRSGATIRTMVTFGLPSQIDGQPATTMDAVDRGRTRSVADQLKIHHGMQNGSAIAAICASIASLCQDERTRRLSVGQTLEIYHEFQAAIDFVIALKPTEYGMRSKGVMAAWAFVISGHSKTSMKKQCSAWYSGRDIASGSPLSQLREFLVSDDAKLLSRRTDRGVAELVLQAIHLAEEGLKVDHLDPSQDGLIRFRNSQPEKVQKIAAMFALPR